MLNMKNIHVNYGPVKALKGVSLDIEKDKITAIIGANGAGKSTLLSVISGLVNPDDGEVIYNNRPIHNIPAEDRVKQGISHVMEGRRLFKDQTVHDNLVLAFHFRNLKKERKNLTLRINNVYERFPVLAEKRNQKAGTLSGGQQQLLIISMAILSMPQLLLLDEPSLGLAPIIVDHVYQYLNELKSNGVTIVISEQMAALALRIADHGYVMERGTIVEHGNVDHLKSLMDSNQLSSIYLGKVKV
ncbi:ABC transporter ATP-binding protein [Bacillus sp. V3-13]|uniref:ABC transporter ATP-binding protein n=1 Tax=Bacillus sp. V3-13 TaxID=2053728 RepID=UPI000C7952F8|nr:ABC transporter ATP-binding protein [Bacillus sp. V3-13]PLR78615.1 ABC transporter ATP-binding protein [Bacillus sp. V3-13]